MTQEAEKRYKMMIVDDEYEIRQGLRQVDYAALGIQVVAVCENGLEALRFMEHTHIDILLTDIKMPLMDGLELIQKTAQSHPYTRKIVLSGYGDFEYARKGMEYGVLDYLLKPLDFEAYGKLLHKTVELLGQERERQLRQSKLERKAKLSAHLLRKQFLGELLRQSMNAESIEIGSSSAEVFLGDKGPYAVCLLRLGQHPNRPPQMKESDWQLALFTLDNVLQDLWDEAGHGYHHVDPYTGQSALIVTAPALLDTAASTDEATPGLAALEAELQRILRALARFRGLFKSHLVYAVGPVVEQAIQIRHSYEAAEHIFRADGDPGRADRQIVMEQLPLASVKDLSSGQRLVEEVKQYIEHNYDRTFTLEDVARHVHLNASYLSYLFKEITGVKYIDYVMGFRIAKAKELLTRSNWKVYEIGEMIGYENPKYFTSIFRKFTGQSPVEYRNTHYEPSSVSDEP